jgi:zinc transport system substrate-binding protein
MLLLLALLACGTPSPTPSPEPPPTAGAPTQEATPGPAPAVAHRLDVRALSFPAAWLAERVGDDRVRVTNVAPAGEDPPAWHPSPELVAGLADADVIVANGAGYEAWTSTASLPEAKVVRTADGLDLIRRQGVTHSHGRGGAHSHAGVDPHTWGDPLLLLEQARVLAGALTAVDPEGKATYDERLAALEGDLRAVDAELSAALAPAKGRRLAASHPAFDYLARRYGLDLTSFGLDPSESASPAARAEVEAWARTAGPEPILLWEAQPSAAAIASLPPGLQHVTLDPLEQPAASGRYDWLAQERTNVAVLRRLFETQPSTPTTPGSSSTAP